MLAARLVAGMNQDVDESSQPLAETPELPVAEGFSAADGLRRAGGNFRLYVDLLRQFVEGQSDAAERIEADLNRGEEGTAERIAHSVKGVAGNIGATAAQAAAGELEKAIRTNADGAHVEVLRLKLASELAKLTASLKPFVESHRPVRDADQAAPPDPAGIDKAVEDLTPLLEDSDPAAIDLLDSQRSALRALFTPEGFAEFERLVSGYSFDEAAVLLRTASAKKRI